MFSTQTARPQKEAERVERRTHGRFIVEDLSVPQDEPATFPGFHLAAHLQQVAGLLQRLLHTDNIVFCGV